MLETGLPYKLRQSFFYVKTQKVVGNFLKNIEKIKRMGYSDNAKLVKKIVFLIYKKSRVRLNL